MSASRARIRRVTSLVAATALAIGGCGAARGPSSEVALSRVVLYQNGLGYFERRGTIEGDRLPLRFAAREVDDVLGTLTVLDARGERTVVSASVPERSESESAGDEVTLEMRMPDRRARDLVVTYALPTPAWRAAYRVVLPDEGGDEALFQVWALVHNASPEDWNGIELSLATSAPFSFAVDLRTPQFVERPEVSGRSLAPALSGAVVADRGHRRREETGSSGVDTDGDRIADANDACPREPETYNGTDDEDGCPDRGTVVISETAITILDRIYFAHGSDELATHSLPIVDAIAATLAHNPQILRVRIGGHAASGEPDGWALSAARAGAVRAALAERGVDRTRLVAEGFGEAMPIDPGTSAAARERNRRVEFEVLSIDDGDDDRPTVSVGRLDASTEAQAEIAEAEGTTQYDVAARVSIPARSSSLVTILSERVRGEPVLLYRPDPSAPASARHPFRAARLVSPERTTLIPGPVAVYAGGTFVGEGLIEALHDGEIATIPYALDGSSTVSVERDAASEPVRIVSLLRGVLTLEDRRVTRTTYVIRPGAHAPRHIHVTHPRTAGTSPRGLPPESEVRDDTLLVPLAISPGRESRVVLEEVSPARRTVTLTEDLRVALSVYLEGSSLPAELAEGIRAIVEARAGLLALGEDLEHLRERLSDAVTRTAELRADLRTPISAELRRTLEQHLREAAASADQLSREIADRQSRAAALRVELGARASALTLEEPAPN